MEISPTFGIVLMMNNYLHDVATALLIATAAAIFALLKVAAKIEEPPAILFFLNAYRRMVKLFHWSLIWIIIGGIPRVLFYTRFEWANAAGKGQVPALVVKHVIMTVLILAGIKWWRVVRRRVEELKALLPASYRHRLES